MKRKFNYEEIKTIVDALDEEEFDFLKEAVNERNIEDYNISIGEIDPNNRVVDDEEVIINGHTYLYGQKQIEALEKKWKQEVPTEEISPEKRLELIAKKYKITIR